LTKDRDGTTARAFLTPPDRYFERPLRLRKSSPTFFDAARNSAGDILNHPGTRDIDA
jgi:hypothetical protein